ncbi:MAG: sigma-70 family RNA polymerase sigma factor [Oscillospiraceae bacterium]|nr:sigma-70 family RNA polymerase sigma factor [Oscillospiraceae bacterium]
MEDSEILELYRTRSEEAIRQTEQKYSRYLTVISNNILNDREDSRECVNDTYLRAWDTIPPHFPERLAGYIGKICRDISIGRYRRKKAAKRGGSEYALSLEELCDCVSGSETPEQALDVKLLAAAIGEYLRTISQQARIEFVQRYYFCDPVKNIALYSGRSESAVKSGLLRTRRGLKEYLEKEGFNI